MSSKSNVMNQCVVYNMLMQQKQKHIEQNIEWSGEYITTGANNNNKSHKSET